MGGDSEQEQLLRLLASSAGLMDGVSPSGGASGIAASEYVIHPHVNVISSPRSEDRQGTRLIEALTPDMLRPVLANERLRQRLFSFLPEKHDRTEEEISSVIRSQQFRQAVEELDMALRSGELGSLIQELGLDVDIAASGRDRVLAFLRAVQKRFGSSSADRMDES